MYYNFDSGEGRWFTMWKEAGKVSFYAQGKTKATGLCSIPRYFGCGGLSDDNTIRMFFTCMKELFSE